MDPTVQGDLSTGSKSRMGPHAMTAATRYIRMLMIGLLAIVAFVPGGLAMTICLCPEAPALAGSGGGSCAMECCEAAHMPSPQAPMVTHSPHDACGACHTFASGEREASVASPAVVDFSHVALLAAPAIAVLPLRPVFCRRPPPVCDSHAPPGQFSNVPLRI